MIIKREKRDGIFIYIVKKDLTDEEMNLRLNTHVKKDDINDIIRNEDCDVFTEDGNMLMRFRRGVLTKANTMLFYDNVVKFAHNTSTNRGGASGVEGTKHVGTNPKIMTNIFGYFDRWGPSQKYLFNSLGKKPLVNVRETRFNLESPEKYQKTIPLLKEVDKLYKKLAPKEYKKQYKKAMETQFRIANTSFTTVTTNINFQTAIHMDKGDDEEGFGNLITFEKGSYSGSETCFPQYGIGVDVRENDFLLMDVHQPHGNLPLILDTPDSERLSIVCYLRKGVWQNARNKGKGLLSRHVKIMRGIFTKKKSLSNKKTKKNKK
tara:strand:+ start:911 stop:1870 length:960 start_codon:yes stop_codon:yes gene_type:complete